jgi:hypothetical protein
MMPKSDPEARSTMSANSNDAATSVKLFILRTLETGLLLETVCWFQRNFKVERLSKANSIARIKKRKTIFDSFQPTISKW